MQIRVHVPYRARAAKETKQRMARAAVMHRYGSRYLSTYDLLLQPDYDLLCFPRANEVVFLHGSHVACAMSRHDYLHATQLPAPMPQL